MCEDEDIKQCFICLGGEQDEDLSLGPLGRHCKCPALFSHRQCLTRWQLQNAGRAEEKQCRFCHAPLEDWKAQIAETSASSGKTRPIMAVVFQGKTVKVPVCTGPDGLAEFKRTVCRLFNLPEGTDFEVTFECKSPVFGDKLQLKGFNCFEAASYCAAVSAAKRASAKAAREAAGGAAAASCSKRSHRTHAAAGLTHGMPDTSTAPPPAVDAPTSATTAPTPTTVSGVLRRSQDSVDGGPMSGTSVTATTVALSRRGSATGSGSSRKASSASNVLHHFVGFFKRLAA